MEVGTYIHVQVVVLIPISQGGFVLRYERRKEIISDEISDGHNITPFQLSPVLVS